MLAEKRIKKLEENFTKQFTGLREQAEASSSRDVAQMKATEAVNAKIEGVNAKIDAKIDGVKEEIKGVNAKIDGVEAMMVEMLRLMKEDE